MLRVVVLVLTVLASRAAEAQIVVNVDLNAEGQALANQLGVTEAELASRIQTRINDAYDTNNVDGFLRSFTDATAFSMRGLGVDYVSMPKNLMLGVGVNFAVAASGDFNAEERPTAGLAPNIGFMAGLNLSEYGSPRWTLFGNGFYRTGSTRSLRGGITSAGLHAQYRVVLPQEDAGAATVLRWTGIDVTSGFEFTRWSLGVDDDITTSFAVDGSSGSARLVLDSTGTFDVRSTAMTIPVDVTTGMRIALLVSLYVGAGIDLTASTGKLTTSLDGNLLTDDMRSVGTATMTGNGDNSGTPFSGRVLAGVQLNLWKLKIYTQVNASPNAANVGAGIRGVL
jgi:hypothetical protein